MYELRIFKQAQKELKKISRLHQKAIIEALGEIEDNPLSGKPLSRELTGRFSYKVGNYRIIYRINKKDKIIQVISVGHRSKIYK